MCIRDSGDKCITISVGYYIIGDNRITLSVVITLSVLITLSVVTASVYGIVLGYNHLSMPQSTITETEQIRSPLAEIRSRNSNCY